MVAKENQNPNKTARLAGFLYLTMVPLGFFGMYGHSNLIVPGDAATTVNNIMASGSLFRNFMTLNADPNPDDPEPKRYYLAQSRQGAKVKNE